MKKFTKNTSLIIPFGIVFFILMSILPLHLQAYSAREATNPEQLHPVTLEVIEDIKAQNAIDIESKKTEVVLQQQIAKVQSFFQSYGAVLQGYEELIVRRSHECGGDYRVIIGIAGNESGLGRIPYKTYNPFGYLDGMQYGSWEESLHKLVCVISQRFITPCQSDLQCIINKYGGPGDNHQQWINNVGWFVRQVTL